MFLGLCVLIEILDGIRNKVWFNGTKKPLRLLGKNGKTGVAIGLIEVFVQKS
jgi:hypothetical protein